jgi:hypothetical protein
VKLHDPGIFDRPGGVRVIKYAPVEVVPVIDGTDDAYLPLAQHGSTIVLERVTIFLPAAAFRLK